MMGMSDKYTCGRRAGRADGGLEWGWAAQKTLGESPSCSLLPQQRDMTCPFGQVLVVTATLWELGEGRWLSEYLG